MTFKPPNNVTGFYCNQINLNIRIGTNIILFITLCFYINCEAILNKERF